jgi:hypothetical protein
VAAENEKERRDRELIELLTELRIALPGVQVLFAFLLTIPFTSGFRRATDVDRDLYFAALIATVVSSICLIVPSSYHRLTFREGVKEEMLQDINVLAIVGMLALGVAISLSVCFVTKYLFGVVATTIATALTVVLIALLWYALPLSQRR